MEWISAKDDKPPIGVKVFVYCDPNSKFKNPLGITTGHYWGENEQKTIHNGWDLTDVTHWRPLFEPPQL